METLKEAYYKILSVDGDTPRKNIIQAGVYGVVLTGAGIGIDFYNTREFNFPSTERIVKNVALGATVALIGDEGIRFTKNLFGWNKNNIKNVGNLSSAPADVNMFGRGGAGTLNPLKASSPNYGNNYGGHFFNL